MNLQNLPAHSQRIKKRMLQMYFQANAGHIGSSLSAAEILTFLWFAWKKENETFILSKGHAAALLYSVLAEAERLSEDDLQTFYRDGTLLAAHPPGQKIKDIPFGTGSLGHGLSLAAGIALSHRLKGEEKNVFCLCSDGEWNEGSTWEALLFSAQFKLTNLNIFIDRNGIQGFGRTEEVMALEPFADKLISFGANLEICDGHDFADLERARKILAQRAGPGPKIFLCNTTKGNGFPDLADTVDCHYLPMTEAQFNQAMRWVEEGSLPDAR
jgi:transketolase